MYNLIEESCLLIINTLYHQSIFCIILFIFIYGLSKFLKEKSPRWQLGLWSLILIRLVLPTDLSFSFSARNLVDELLVSDRGNISITNVSGNMKLEKDINQNREYNLFRPAVIQENRTVQASQNLNNDRDTLVSWPIILSLTWFIGCLLLLILFLNKIFRINRVLKNSSLIKASGIVILVDYWCKSYKIKRPVKVFTSHEFMSPFTVGLIQPKIFIPKSLLEGMDNIKISSIIAHEMVHIKHFDYFWVRLQNVLQIIYFFHPVVWYANRQINIARERVCDSIVLEKQVIRSKDYGKSVLDVLKFNLSGSRFIEPLIFFSNHKEIFEHRIKAIMKGGAMSKQKTLLISSIICLIGIFLLPMSKNQPNAMPLETKTEDREIKSIKSRDSNVLNIHGFNKSIIEKEPHVGIDIISPDKMQISTTASGNVMDVESEDLSGDQISIHRNVNYEANNSLSDGIFSEEAKTVNTGEDTVSNGNEDRSSVTPPRFTSIKAVKPEDKINKFPEGTLEKKEYEVEPPKIISKDIQFQKDTLILTMENKQNASHDENINNFYGPEPKQDRNVSENAGKQHSLNVDNVSPGNNYLQKGEIDEAISNFSKAIEITPEYIYAYINRGKVYQMKKQYVKAFLDFSKAREIEPNYAPVYTFRASPYKDRIDKYISFRVEIPKSRDMEQCVNCPLNIMDWPQLPYTRPPTNRGD